VDNGVSDSLRERLLSFFPAGTFARVDVLGYGDDPGVEPGDTAIRVFIDRAGRPEEDWDSRDTLHEWAEAQQRGSRQAARRAAPVYRLDRVRSRYAGTAGRAIQAELGRHAMAGEAARPDGELTGVRQGRGPAGARRPRGR
jgi:hypothetical protein